MKFLFDIFPVLLFFVAINIWDIFVATAVAIGATVLQVAWLAVRRKKIEPMLWASLGIIVVFGGLTLYLRDKTFILWKPTVLYWLFASLLAGATLFGRNLVKSLLSEHLQMPEPVWSRLNWSWAAFFGVLGCANLYVAYHFPEKIWAAFKLFGCTGLTLLFVVAQTLFISKYVTEKH